MAKRGKLEIIYDILKIISDSRNKIKPTPLLRQSNISSSRFKDYFNELVEKEFIVEKNISGQRIIQITEKGIRFLDKYRSIVSFIDEFDL